MHIAVLLADTAYEQIVGADVERRLAALGTVRRASGTTAAITAAAAALLAEADAALAGPGTPRLQEDWLDAAPHLRLIFYCTGSVRQVVPPSVFRRGIALCHNAPTIADAVAEFCIGLELLCLRQYHRLDRALKAGEPWPQVQTMLGGRLLRGRLVGLVGSGYVAQRHITLLHAFGAHVRVADPYLSAERAAELDVERATLEQVFGESDIIAIHTPQTPETHHMIGAALLATIQPGAILIQNSRAWVMDQEALLRELQSGRFVAALDVFDREPQPPDSPFYQLDNVLVSPHMAGKAADNRERMGVALVEELARFARGEPLHYQIRQEQYDHLA